MTRVSARDLRKVENHPEVRAANEALSDAAEVAREAHRAAEAASRLVDQRADELHKVAARVLAEQSQEGKR